MIPSIIDSTKIEDLLVVALNNGTLCVGYEISIVDAENENLRSIESDLIAYLGQLSNSIRVRMVLESLASHDSSVHSRSDAVNSIGFVENHLYVFFEKDQNPLKVNIQQIKGLFKPQKILIEDAKSFLSEVSIDTFANLGLTPRPLDLEDYNEFLPDLNIQISHTDGVI